MILNNLPYPMSINAYYRSVYGRTLISKKGREYRNRVFGYIVEKNPATMGGYDFVDPIEMRIAFYPPDKRKRDIDNPLKPLIDALMNAKIYKDDSQIKKLVVTMNEPVKGGRVDVTIIPIAHVKDGKVVGLKQETLEK